MGEIYSYFPKEEIFDERIRQHEEKIKELTSKKEISLDKETAEILLWVTSTIQLKLWKLHTRLTTDGFSDGFSKHEPSEQGVYNFTEEEDSIFYPLMIAIWDLNKLIDKDWTLTGDHLKKYR